MVLPVLRIDRIELILVKLPLVRPFRTSSSWKDAISHILVRAEADGLIGWGECACPADPYYCPETVETCWHLLRDFLAPAVLGQSWDSIEAFSRLYGPVKGNRFARAGIEMAAWDLLGRARGQSLAAMLGGTRTQVESGVSLGIEADRSRLFDLIAQYQAEGYQRIKLKIAPGHDVELVAAVRERFPALPLQVDANSAYTLADVDRLRELDAFELLLIEQPLADDDLVDHARLQERLRTPICLDESLHTAADALKAIELGSCRVVNIKVSRVGGPLEALRMHEVCRARGIPVWCGGMHEFGIGRAANLAVASLPGFELAGDVSGSDKYYREDLIEPPFRAEAGRITVPSGPGLGVEPVGDRVARATLRTHVLTANL